MNYAEEKEKELRIKDKLSRMIGVKKCCCSVGLEDPLEQTSPKNMEKLSKACDKFFASRGIKFKWGYGTRYDSKEKETKQNEQGDEA